MVFQSFLFGLISAFTVGVADLLAASTSRRIGIFRVIVATHVVAVVLSTTYLPFAFDFSGVSPGDWRDLFLLSLLVIVTRTVLYKALQIGPVAVVSPIVATPLAAILLAVVVGGERLTSGQVVGIVITVSGVAMTSVDIRELNGGRRLIGTGPLLAFATMLGAGTWAYLMGSLSQKLGWFQPGVPDQGHYPGNTHPHSDKSPDVVVAGIYDQDGAKRSASRCPGDGWAVCVR